MDEYPGPSVELCTSATLAGVHQSRSGSLSASSCVFGSPGSELREVLNMNRAELTRPRNRTQFLPNYDKGGIMLGNIEPVEKHVAPDTLIASEEVTMKSSHVGKS